AEPRAAVLHGTRERPRLGELAPEHAEIPEDRGLAFAVRRDLEQVDDDRVAGPGAANAHRASDGRERMAVARGREGRRHREDVLHVVERAPHLEGELLAGRHLEGRRRGGVDVEQVPEGLHAVSLRRISSNALSASVRTSSRVRIWIGWGTPFAFEMSRSVTILPSRLDGRGAVFRGTATESVGSRYSLMGLPPNYGVRTCRNTRAELFANVQPGTIAEKRPAVPPATTI